MRGLIVAAFCTTGLFAQTGAFPPAGGGGSTSPGPPANAVQFNNAGAFGGSDRLKFDVSAAALTIQVPNVVATAVSNTSGGGTYYEYWVIATFAGGKSTGAPLVFPSTYVVIEDGPATLDSTHYIDISWPTVSGATGYDIWTDDREGTVSSIGKLGSVGSGTITFRDDGAVGDNVLPNPYTPNTTGSLTLGTVTLKNCVGCGILFNSNQDSVYVGNGYAATKPILSEAADNVALGSGTLQNATTGSHANTAVGGGSQSGNTTGTNNTSLGVGSLEVNSTGQYNVAVGEGALQISNGDANTAVGEEAGSSITGGGQNTIVGAEAWKTQATGNFNSIFGAKAGGDALGDRNVFIGYSAGKSDTGSDHLCIDNIDTAGCLVSGDFSARTLFFNGRVGATPHTPASSSEACTAGQFSDDDTYHYVCTGTNTWKRVALSSF